MIARRFRLFAFAVLTFLGGCVELDTPLSDPTTAEPDKALCGVWQSTKKNADSGTVFVFVGLQDKDTGVPRGLMRLMMPSVDRTSLKLETGGPACGFVTRINDVTYFNAIGTEDGTDLLVKANYDAWAARPVRKTKLGKYKVDGDTLVVWTGLSGNAYKDFAARHGITDSPSLAAYLQKSGDGELFPDESPAKPAADGKAELDMQTYKLTFTRVR